MSNNAPKKTTEEQKKGTVTIKSEPVLFHINPGTDPEQQASAMTAAQKGSYANLLVTENPKTYGELYPLVNKRPCTPRQSDSMHKARREYHYGLLRRLRMKIKAKFDDEVKKEKSEIEQKTKEEARRLYRDKVREYILEYKQYLAIYKSKEKLFREGDCQTVEEYFRWVLEQDACSVSFEGIYNSGFSSVEYINSTKTLIVYSRIPNTEEISVFSHFIYNRAFGRIDGYEMNVTDQKRYRVNVARKLLLRQASLIFDASAQYGLVETVKMIGYQCYAIAGFQNKVDVMVAMFRRDKLRYNIGDNIEAIYDDNQIEFKKSTHIYELPPEQLIEVHQIKAPKPDETDAVEQEKDSQ